MKEVSRPLRAKKKKQKPQPEPRRYTGVFWNSSRGQWTGQKTHPEGHKPRQQQVCWDLDQKKCAVKLARILKVDRDELLLPGLGPVEADGARLYSGVGFSEDTCYWFAQITMPPGTKPRQVSVGRRFSSQKEAAVALYKKMNELKVKDEDGRAKTWKLSDLSMKKAEVYKGRQAMMGQVSKFKFWSGLFVKKRAKKSWNPGGYI